MNRRKIPKGLRDLLPEEVKQRRHMERRVSTLFQSYGYREIATPTIEFLDVVEGGPEETYARSSFFLWTGRVRSCP
jgi:Histidyl-tRNA synthetase